MVGADERLFQWINGAVGRWDLLDDIMTLLVSDFFLPVVISVAAFAMWFAGRSGEERLRNQMGFIYAVSGAGFANLFVRIFNDHFERARPFLTLEDVEVLFYAPTDPTFPSNAAAYAFAMAAGVWLGNRRWGYVIGAFAFVFSFGRVYAGMHFPLDVVAGALMGILTTYLFSRLVVVLKPILDLAFRVVRAFYLA